MPSKPKTALNPVKKWDHHSKNRLSLEQQKTEVAALPPQTYGDQLEAQVRRILNSRAREEKEGNPGAVFVRSPAAHKVFMDGKSGRGFQGNGHSPWNQPLMDALKDHARWFAFQRWDPRRPFSGATPESWKWAAIRDFEYFWVDGSEQVVHTAERAAGSGFGGQRNEERAAGISATAKKTVERAAAKRLTALMGTSKEKWLESAVERLFLFHQGGERYLYRNSVFFQLLEIYGGQEAEYACKWVLDGPPGGGAAGAALGGHSVPEPEDRSASPAPARGAGVYSSFSGAIAPADGRSTTPTSANAQQHFYRRPHLTNHSPPLRAHRCGGCGHSKVCGQADLVSPEKEWYCVSCFQTYYGIYPWHDRGRDDMLTKVHAMYFHERARTCAQCTARWQFGRDFADDESEDGDATASEDSGSDETESLVNVSELEEEDEDHAGDDKTGVVATNIKAVGDDHDEQENKTKGRDGGSEPAGESVVPGAEVNELDEQFYCCRCIGKWYGCLPLSLAGLQKAMDGASRGGQARRKNVDKRMAGGKKKKPAAEETNWKRGRREGKKLVGEAKKQWKEELKRRKKRRTQNKRKKQEQK